MDRIHRVNSMSGPARRKGMRQPQVRSTSLPIAVMGMNTAEPRRVPNATPTIVQLAHQVAAVGADGVDADEQAFGDLGVAAALGNQTQDLVLSLRESGGCRRSLRR